jgi:6-phosphogluconolactonase
MRLLFLVAWAAGLLSASLAQPQTQTAENAIRDVVKRYVDARDHADEAAIRALFTDDADQLTSSGEWRRGREELVRGTLASSKGNPGARTITLETIRFPSSNVAVADGRYEIAGTAGAAPRRMWTSFLMVQAGNAWRIAAIRNMLPAAAAQPSGGAAVSPEDTLVYVGTYTDRKIPSRGIYAYRLQPGSRTLAPVGLAAESRNPSFLAIDAGRQLLFAVNELDEFEGKPTGAVSAFAIDRATGMLRLINQRPSMGRAPCHLVLDKSGRHLLVANYTSGTVAVLPVAADGRLGDATAVVQHAGSSVNPRRQQGPHAHCMTFDPAHRFVFACDLGLDKVLAYRFDADRGTLTPHDPPFATVKPGAGPRHMAFRPDGRFAYVLNELDSTVTTFAYDASAGAMKEVATVSTLPPDSKGSNSGAEIAMHPSGRYVYASNRGHDSVAVFAIDPGKGTLTFIAAEPSGGRAPRHFGLDASGRVMTIAGQDSGTLLTGAIDPESGRFQPSGPPVSAPTPVFVGFLPPGR